MKRLILLGLMILNLLPVKALTEQNHTSELYPFRENNLWGYINREGKTVIKPQWDWACEFNGNYAIVESDSAYGLILRDGSYAVPVQYGYILDCGSFFSVWQIDEDSEESYGWYDKVSGFFQEPIYTEIDETETDSNLIFVGWSDEDESNYHNAYCYRDSGNIAFLFDYTGEALTSGTFHEGYAYWRLGENDEETDEICIDEFLIDTQGHRIGFPEGVHPGSDVHDGMLRVTTDYDDKQNPLSGLAYPDGTIIFTLTDSNAYLISNSSEDRLFYRQDGETGIVDLLGNTILPPVLDYAEDVLFFGGGKELFFRNGYAVVPLRDKQNGFSCIIVNRGGRVVFQTEKDSALGIKKTICTYVMKDGLVFYSCSSAVAPDENRYGLILLTDQGSEILTEPVFDHISSHPQGILDFSEDLMAVSQDGYWGYIDNKAQWIIPPQFDKAENFRDGLARVEREGKILYIDHDGKIIWREQ